MQPDLTPCRPSRPRQSCEGCARRDVPILHRTKGGRFVDHVVMDPTAVLRGRACELRVIARALEAA